MSEPAKVVDIGKGRRVKCSCPDRLPPEEAFRLLKLAQRDRFTLHQVAYAWQQVSSWAQTNGRQRTDWVMVAFNALRQGWGLRGFKAWWDRRYPQGVRPPANYPGVTLTDEVIAAYMERRK